MTKEEVLQKYAEVANAISKIEELPDGSTLDLEHLILACNLFNSQKSTGMIENELIRLKGWKKIDKSRDCGDYFDSNDQIFELKISVGTQGKINLNQLREWQGGFTTNNNAKELMNRVVNPPTDTCDNCCSLEGLKELYKSSNFKKGSWGIVWDDYKGIDGKVYEKVSTQEWRDTHMTFANFTGVDYYLVIYFDLIDPLHKSIAYKITHENLFHKGIKLANMHMTTIVNEENKKSEKKLSFSINNVPKSFIKNAEVIEAGRLFDNSQL